MEIAFGYNSTDIHFIHSVSEVRRVQKFKISSTRKIDTFIALTCAIYKIYKCRIVHTAFLKVELERERKFGETPQQFLSQLLLTEFPFSLILF